MSVISTTRNDLSERYFYASNVAHPHIKGGIKMAGSIKKINKVNGNTSLMLIMMLLARVNKREDGLTLKERQIA